MHHRIFRNIASVLILIFSKCFIAAVQTHEKRKKFLKVGRKGLVEKIQGEIVEIKCRLTVGRWKFWVRRRKKKPFEKMFGDK